MKALRTAALSTSTFERILVTPDMAREWLATSRSNRKIRRTVVLRYLLLMQRGMWLCSPRSSSIDFGTSGRLVGGHHRLQAVILFGQPVLFRIERGVTEPERDAEGNQERWPLVDNLERLHKYTHVRRRIAYLRMGIELLAPEVRVAMVADWDLWYPIFEPGIDWAVEAFGAAPPGIQCGAVAGTLAFAHRTDPAPVEKFGEALASGASLRDGHPALTLRRLLLANRMDRAGYRRVGSARKVLVALRAAMAGQSLTKVCDSLTVVQDFTTPYHTPKLQGLIDLWAQKTSLFEPNAAARRKNRRLRALEAV